MAENKVFFIADLHLSHKNILSYQPNRIEAFGLADNKDIENMNEAIIDMWLSMTKRHDQIYVLGDFIMTNIYDSMKMLHRLKSNGCKIHLIVGNHDKATKSMNNMFESMSLIKVQTFKKNMFEFLDNDLTVVMCHYPMKSWPHKAHGSLHLYGHTHDNSLFEMDNNDLSFNVGLDVPYMNHRLISLEEIYEMYKKKLNGMTPKAYIEYVSKTDKTFIR